MTLYVPVSGFTGIPTISSGVQFFGSCYSNPNGRNGSHCIIDNYSVLLTVNVQSPQDEINKQGSDLLNIIFSWTGEEVIHGDCAKSPISHRNSITLSATAIQTRKFCNRYDNFPIIFDW